MTDITGTGGNDTIAPLLNTAGALRPGAGDDRIEGLGGADSLAGAAGIDTLLGGEGNDTLDGGAGFDLLDGGTGIDWLSYAADTAGVSIDLYFLSARGGDAEGDSIAPGFEALLGGTGADAIIANDTVAETLLGGDGADTLMAFGDFGTSNDWLDGGAGEDSITAQAGANTLRGGQGADMLRGGAGADLLEGGTDADTILGGAGDDTLSYATSASAVTISLALRIAAGGDAQGDSLGTDIEAVLGSAHADALNGRSGNDSLFGGGGADTLAGGFGNDWLVGGGAADRMLGGAGHDTYSLDDIGDVATEAANQGRDLVLTARAAYALGANLEDVTAAGGTTHRFTGNALANAITGGAFADTLIGGDGADTLAGLGGIDRLLGGAGDDAYILDQPGDVVLELANQGFDTLRTTLATVTLGLNIEAVVATNDIAHRFTGNALDNALTGGMGADTLAGAGGADTLDGGTGGDRLLGGLGNDRYVTTSGDVVVEFAGQGADTVVATTGTVASLGLNLEALVLQGGTLVRGLGNGLDNLVVGNAGANLLYGLAGHDSLAGGQGADILIGGAGRDTLSGGAGNDVFRLLAATESTAADPDRITDFTRAGVGGIDRIDLRFIDANTLLAGDQAFAFIGAAAFAGGGAAGQWRVAAAGAGTWRAEGDTNGDGAADVAVVVASAAAPVAGWFLL
jgi:Ca2+-binding RTX toxin-like protein